MSRVHILILILSRNLMRTMTVVLPMVHKPQMSASVAFSKDSSRKWDGDDHVLVSAPMLTKTSSQVSLTRAKGPLPPQSHSYENHQNRQQSIDGEGSTVATESATVALEEHESTDFGASHDWDRHATPKRSILKVSPLFEPLVSEKRGSWKQLPRPDMDAIRQTFRSSQQSLPELIVEEDETSENRTAPPCKQVSFAPRISFDYCEVRRYSQTIGDNPSCSYGTPISLDWDYEETVRTDLDQYEASKGPRKPLRGILLNYYQRREILIYRMGFSEEEVENAEKQANRIKRLRSFTKAMLPAQKIEEALQSAKRKATRLIK